jgi:ferredoxin-NADP reductase/MOSC domain-containing protein YiiM
MEHRPDQSGGSLGASGPRLVSVNVGLPKVVDWNGRSVRTGVWKYPVAGPRMVRSLNLDGDGQGDLAGHGGPYRAVLVYQLASYGYWRQVLARDDLEPGNFGENFTVDGLADDEVCIGDRYRIGEALFEVTQPRVTCYRVGLRMGEPRLPALLVSHRRPGFYLRVLDEGVVRAGDAIVKVATGRHALTVADVDALLYLPGHDRGQVALALEIPALSPGWKASFEALLNADDGVGTTGNVGLNPVAGTPAPAWPGFRTVRVVERIAESTDVVSLRLASTDGTPLPPALPGQFLPVRLDVGGAEPAVTRNYSLSGRPGAAEYRISVKREPHGVASRHVHAVIRAGATLEAAAPRGTFTLASGDGPVLLISAGIGVTPVLAMLHALVEAGSTREVWWLHGARHGEENPFAIETAELLRRLSTVHVQICFSAPLPTDRPGLDYTHRGRLSADFLTGLRLPPDVDGYVCGPASFMDDVRTALAGVGIDAERVRTEVFGPGLALAPGVVPTGLRPVHQPPGESGSGPAVTFARSGLTVRWRQVDPSLLDLAEACDVPARWSCRTGVCHNCETAMLAGDVSYQPDPLDPPATGNVLICCATPTSDVVLDL